MTSLGHDLRYAFRSLRRTPGFALAAITALALGIGATTTIFTVVNGVLLRPLDYRDPERLANIWNDLGEVRVPARVSQNVRPGVVFLPKGLWSKHTLSGTTSNALSPDTFTDIGGGACFNDARVQVAWV